MLLVVYAFDDDRHLSALRTVHVRKTPETPKLTFVEEERLNQTYVGEKHSYEK
jgi:hypothetical protein